MAIPRVELTPAESLFHRFLLDCRDQKAPGLDLRFTGGWVRDKLLGVPSHDIDVALSSMTGWQFAHKLQEFVTDGAAAQYEQEAQALHLKSPLGTIHQIAANPEKSKHLETVTTRMFGFDVDLVNLRKEIYAEDSRNPQMEFGTPEEDALRRDATINALFYNLQTGMVEDFTGKGLDDMKKKIIRTPLPPYKTFKDDPLRVLRLIRFASRLDYDIEPDSKDAMKNKSIHAALQAKISRERVGTEVGKMLSGPDPYRAAMLIYDLDLHKAVFGNPTDHVVPDLTHLPAVYEGLQGILQQLPKYFEALNLHDDTCLVWHLAAYTPWHESEEQAVAASKDAIKATRRFLKILGDSVRYREKILKLIGLTCQTECSRSSLGMSLRQLGPAWPSHVTYSMLCDLGCESADGVIVRYQNFLQKIIEKDLLGAAQVVPILNGNKIQGALDAKGGPWLAKAMEMIVIWQFDNPASTAEEATEMIKGKKAQLGCD